WPLGSTVQKNLLLSATCSTVQRCPAFTSHLLSLAPASSMWAPCCDSLQLCEWPPIVSWDLSRVQADSVKFGYPPSPPLPKGSQSLVISCIMSTVSGHLLYYSMSAVSGHLLYYVRSLWSSPVLCVQSLVISCTVRSLWSSPVLCPQSLVISCSTVCSLWSSPVLCPQSLVISCTMSAV
ncbi:unnamed protein product, partial [Staurois parvus]